MKGYGSCIHETEFHRAFDFGPSRCTAFFVGEEVYQPD